MIMKNLHDIPVYKTLFERDQNERQINIYHISSVQFSPSNTFYPAVVVKDRKQGLYYKLVDEKIMSLKSIDHTFKIDKCSKPKAEFTNPLFFFIYNTDNYYHFVWDTLPYLISYFLLKKEIKGLKLLVNLPNFSANEFYPFFLEFLDILEIEKSDIVLVDKDLVYGSVYISDSYTHGVDSNKPPRNEIYQFYKEIVSKVNKRYNLSTNLPKKIYISRRSWLHNDFSNMGTNYTLRRKLVNESELVKILENRNYVEIFTERLSTVEKIQLFSNVEEVVSTIGGGSCNVLFANNWTKHFCIVSPTFLEINERFKFCLSTVNTLYFEETKHVEEHYFKKYMRVKLGDLVGEVLDYDENRILFSYTDNIVAGWNSNLMLNKMWVNKQDLIAVDMGLNSAWDMNLEKFEQILDTNR